MALKSSAYLKSMLDRVRGASTFSTSTTPEMKKARAPIIEALRSPEVMAKMKRGDFVPVGVALGMIMVSTSLGLNTAMQQLRHSPNVYVRKSRRETLPEVVEPEHVAEESKQFIKKSLFRKVGHLRDPKRSKVVPNPINGDILTRQPHVETLKDIGVEPKLQ